MEWGEFPSPSTLGRKSISGKSASFRIRRFAAGAAAFLIAAGALFFIRAPKTLAAADTGSGFVYGRWPVAEGTEFFIEFVHSVNQSPVREVFQVRRRRIVPLATVFSSFGAGMQTGLAEGQTLSREAGGALRITGFTASHRELTYIVGTVSDHILGINNEEISLRDLCGKNAHVTLRIR